MKQQKISKSNPKINPSERKLRFAGYLSLSVLGLLIVTMLCPLAHDGANATDCTLSSTDPDCAKANIPTYFSATIQPTISLSLDSNAEVDITPSSTGTFEHITKSLTISTNNPAGYKIYLSSTNAGGTLNGTTGNTQKILPISGETTSSGFGQNTWGYNLSPSTASINDSTTYKAVPTSTSSPVQTVTTTSLNDSYKLTFAANVDSTLKADTYSSPVLVSVVTSPIAVTQLMQLTYMQDMDSAICSGSNEGDSKQLVDSRDGKKYYVTKLKDGNCWMTQNLALELKDNMTLTPSDSDVTSNWVVPAGTMKSVGTAGGGKANSIDMWKLTTTDTATNGNPWQEDYGYFYTFGAATASSGNSLVNNGDIASSSICPKGWRLPTGGASGEYKVVLDGLNTTDVRVTPYYFVLGGAINTSGAYYYGGFYGHYRTSTVLSNTNSYSFNFSDSGLEPEVAPGRSLGYSVRCIAK